MTVKRQAVTNVQSSNTTPRQASLSIWQRFASFSRSALPPVLVFVLAFFPRAIGFVGGTSIWQERVRIFVEAIANRDWGATLLAPHPGVTTMWLGAFARWLGSFLLSGFDDLSISQQSAIEGIPFALVVSLAIVLAYLIISRVFDRQVALIAALMLALDPYHILHSKAVHIDAPSSVFAMISALFLWVFLVDRSWYYILLSGILGALALLTKTPTLFLVPYFFLFLVVWQVSRWLPPGRGLSYFRQWPDLSQRLREVGIAILIWALAYAVTYFAIWPSMWVQPVKTLGVTFGGTNFYRETPHENPIFFLGRPRNTDPGLLFYPITMAIETTAIELIGFLLTLPLLFNRKLERHTRLALWLGLAFVVFFTAQMTLGAKKFERYALPALQFVVILAGVGWVYFARWVTRGRSFLLYLLLFLVVAAQFATSIPRHPYYGTHYNYLLGGPNRILGNGIVAGQEKGEGIAIAAEYLNSLPLSKLLVVGTPLFGGFYHYFDGKAVPLTDDVPDYILFTRNSILRGVHGQEWESVWETYRTRQPKYVVEFDGVPYVWVYKTGPVIEEADIPYPLHAKMGQTIELLGYGFEPNPARPGETVTLVLYWESLGQQNGDYTVFTHLVDPSGKSRAQKDNQPQDARYPTYLWDPAERVEDTYELMLDPSAPPGEYNLAVGMYTLQTMERLPITTQAGEPVPDNQLLLRGPEVLASSN